MAYQPCNRTEERWRQINSLMLRRDAAQKNLRRLILVNASRRFKGSAACNLRAFEAIKQK